MANEIISSELVESVVLGVFYEGMPLSSHLSVSLIKGQSLAAVANGIERVFITQIGKGLFDAEKYSDLAFQATKMAYRMRQKLGKPDLTVFFRDKVTVMAIVAGHKPDVAGIMSHTFIPAMPKKSKTTLVESLSGPARDIMFGLFKHGLLLENNISIRTGLAELVEREMAIVIPGTASAAEPTRNYVRLTPFGYNVAFDHN